MEKFIKVAKREGKPHEDIPLNDDGALALSILHKYFPRAIGLKYFSDTDVSHEIDMLDEKFYPPLGLWGDMTYYCILSAEPSELCIEDIPMYVEADNRNNSLNMVHISIKQSTKPAPRRKVIPHKGKYKKRKPYKCDICDKGFRNQNYVERHKMIHTGEKPHACTICEERFARPDLLRIHVNKIHNIRRKPKHVLQPRDPVSRNRKRRKDDNLYEWGEIKKRKYTRRNTSKKNDDYTEESSNDEDLDEGKFYECNNCAVQFASKSSLKQHSCISNLQTQFTCEECHQTFSKLNKLRLHLYRCHADQKPKNIPAVKTEPTKPTHGKIKGKCKYAITDAKRESSDVESSDDDITFWEYQHENEHASYTPKCNCIPDFNIVKYIEQKIPSEILTKFKYCKENNIPWTGFLGYSALYKFWARIVTDNPIDALYENSTEIVHIVDETDNENVADYLIREEEVEPSEATTENTNFLKGLDDLIKFN